MSQWHNLSIEEVIKKLNTNKSEGLFARDINSLQEKYGKNILPEQRSISIFSIFISQFKSPLIYLLLAASAISFFIGEVKDALVILIVVILNSIIGAFQEGRAESSLLALKKMTQLKARVKRDNKEFILDSSELVPGDIIILSAGDAVPSDARLIEASSLAAAEASLTGESLPVIKTTSAISSDVPLADRINMVYAGTHITTGRGLAVVIASGLKNEIGKIANLTSDSKQSKTQLELKIDRFGKTISYVAIGLFFLVIGVGSLHDIPLAEIFMVAVSQMVSLVPEGLPVALTVALAVGVQRMAKKRTIVRKLSAVETLGSTSVICTDKTGTLTKNEMTVTSVYLSKIQKTIEVTGVGYNPNGKLEYNHKTSDEIKENVEPFNTALKNIVEALVLCNDSQLIPPEESKSSNWKIIGDPTEAALLTFAMKSDFDYNEIRKHHKRVAELPFDSSTKMMATQHNINGGTIVYIKGAFESLLELSEKTDDKEIKNAALKMGESALRVLAVGVVKGVSIDGEHLYSIFKGKVEILGLIGELDPPRLEVQKSIAECYSAGIRPVMVTGDHKATALAIAIKLGITNKNGKVFDGQEMENWSELDWEQNVNECNVFARVHPEQKLKIVQAFQKKENVVAMTGDGVNDAPALMKSDIGVAMGITGTEVAKEAAKIIITDDNFSTIVDAVSEGRLVYQNIKKLLLFLFVTSIDEVLILLLALIFGFPPPLAAVQILWLNLVSEGALTVNLIMEPPEGDEMSRKPVSMTEPLLDKNLLQRIPLMVFVSVLTTFGWFLFRTKSGVPADQVQTETFTVLVVNQWFNVLNCRSSTKSIFTLSIFKNYWLLGGLVFANIMHGLVIYWTPLSQFFHTVPIDLDHFFVIGAISSLVLWFEELRKFFVRKKYDH